MSKNTKAYTMLIKEDDIATIEKLHDLLLDNHGYDPNHPCLKKARKLTHKMYKSIGYYSSKITTK